MKVDLILEFDLESLFSLAPLFVQVLVILSCCNYFITSFYLSQTLNLKHRKPAKTCFWKIIYRLKCKTNKTKNKNKKQSLINIVASAAAAVVVAGPVIIIIDAAVKMLIRRASSIAADRVICLKALVAPLCPLMMTAMRDNKFAELKDSLGTVSLLRLLLSTAPGALHTFSGLAESGRRSEWVHTCRVGCARQTI